ncbi:MAG: carbon storage regulator [Gammaproteobacteria bacterium]|nr:carbon storage regulator [Gammaproteobacteria bacterium]
MLILSRRPGQSFHIFPSPQLTPDTPVEMVFGSAPIEITVTRVLGMQVRLGISTHPQLIVLRRELVR